MCKYKYVSDVSERIKGSYTRGDFYISKALFKVFKNDGVQIWNTIKHVRSKKQQLRKYV